MPSSLHSEQKLENFLTHLARHRDLSASTQNQAFNAILFFYNEVLRQTIILRSRSFLALLPGTGLG